MQSKQVIINNETGLHARPASIFVKEACKYQSEITINIGGKEADAKSIMSILALGAKKGQVVQICATGSDEENAIQGLLSLFEKNFGE